MNRKNIYKEGGHGIKEYVGWFDLDAADKLAAVANGNPYRHYTDVFLTAGGKLISGESTNFDGCETFYRVCGDRLAAEMIVDGGTCSGGAWAEGKGAKEFAAAEIK